jgi:hypothetical protein
LPDLRMASVTTSGHRVCMETNKIKHRIESEVEKAIAVLERGDQWDLRLLSWLRESLTDPRVVELKISTPSATESALFWLVTEATDTWYIVYDPQSDGFGLAGHVRETERLTSTERDAKPSDAKSSPGELVEALGELSSAELGDFFEEFSARFSDRAERIDPPIEADTFLGSYGSLVNAVRSL